jgi:hypothetical protein
MNRVEGKLLETEVVNLLPEFNELYLSLSLGRRQGCPEILSIIYVLVSEYPTPKECQNSLHNTNQLNVKLEFVFLLRPY